MTPGAPHGPNPKPQTVNPINPKPQTLNLKSKPQTPNPKPKSRTTPRGGAQPRIALLLPQPQCRVEEVRARRRRADRVAALQPFLPARFKCVPRFEITIHVLANLGGGSTGNGSPFFFLNLTAQWKKLEPDVVALIGSPP